MEIDMHDVARWAVEKLSHPLPKPRDPYDLLAAEFSRAAREETRYDQRTRQPYRVNHAYTTGRGSDQITLWLDIDDPSVKRPAMLKCFVQRREQMVGDAVQLTLDFDHWNASHPSDEPISLPLDFGPDVEWRKNGPQEQAS
jgi:hypothetical protein